jgi:hypothetical protein
LLICSKKKEIKLKSLRQTEFMSVRGAQACTRASAAGGYIGFITSSF